MINLLRSWDIRCRTRYKKWKKRQLYQWTLYWNRIPTKRKETYVYLGNYVLSAFFISLVLYYLWLFDYVWVRYLFLIPIVTIVLIYMEHYYKWFRSTYKDQ